MVKGRHHEVVLHPPHFRPNLGNPDHAAQRAEERRRLLLALVIRSRVLVAEVVGGLLSHSLALLSDAGHMLSDAVAQALSLMALAIASRPGDARRTYGWYRLEILTALLNGVTLLPLAAWIPGEGWQRPGPPADVRTGTMMTLSVARLARN